MKKDLITFLKKHLLNRTYAASSKLHSLNLLDFASILGIISTYSIPVERR